MIKMLFEWRQGEVQYPVPQDIVTMYHSGNKILDLSPMETSDFPPEGHPHRQWFFLATTKELECFIQCKARSLNLRVSPEIHYLRFEAVTPFLVDCYAQASVTGGGYVEAGIFVPRSKIDRDLWRYHKERKEKEEREIKKSRVLSYHAIQMMLIEAIAQREKETTMN